MPKKHKNKKKSRWFIKTITIFFVLSAVIFTYAYFYYVVYAQKFYPGMKLGIYDLKGRDYLEVINLANLYTDDLLENGITFRFNDEKVIVFPIISSEEGSDIIYEIIKLNSEKTVSEIYDYGRQGNIFQRLIEQMTALVSGAEASLKYQIAVGDVQGILKDTFSKHESPALNAHLKLNDSGELEITPEKDGLVFNYQAVIEEAKQQIGNLENNAITLNLVKDFPVIESEKAGEALSQANELAEFSPLVLLYENKKWEINKEDLKKFLDLKYKKGEITTGFNQGFEDYLNNKLAEDINQEVKEGKFELIDGKVTEFQGSQNGLALDVNGTVETAEAEFVGKRNAQITVSVKEILPSVTTESINDLGIKDLLGTGHSNFAGSPKNRRHNIKVGAETLHGLLIKPDEEFSLVKALGEIEASTGYLPELVIKGNKTIPEYGGGLCQIGTTTFRAVMASALPVTERRNHSYNVSYYLENGKPGTDATIYPPHPDMRFINDTGLYILIQTRIEGNDIYFDFWGTKDGREASRTIPKVWGWTKPPPTKIIETTDLAPGKKKCTERAHSGVSTEFTYTINYPNGEVKEQVFSSRYKPWQEVCLVGVEKEA